jgi:hypothetical protein
MAEMAGPTASVLLQPPLLERHENCRNRIAYCAPIDLRRGVVMRVFNSLLGVFNSLLGVEHSLFGSTDFPLRFPGNQPNSSPSHYPEWIKPTEASAGPEKFPAAGNLRSWRRPSLPLFARSGPWQR